MKQLNPLKYLGVFTLPLTVYIAFTSQGWLTYLPILYIFGLVPFVELLMKAQHENIDSIEEEKLLKNPIFDGLLYLTLPIQYGFLVFFLFAIQEAGLSNAEIAGRTLSMGLMCGVLGINVAHELGHRDKPYEQFMAKMLLLSSLYMHFFIEHNRGHHRKVATEDDPASSRFNETVYVFWFRSVIGCYLSAWTLENQRLSKKGQSAISLRNEMVVYQLIQLGLLASLYVVFNSAVMLAFIVAASVGFLLLETVNYIEHYGLQRNKKANGKHYERVLPHHSWNSDHMVGRVLLFELSRHSDHHYLANRKYQVLRYHEEAPQMPTGYPGMMLLALVPPLWFWQMNPRIKKLNRLATAN